VEDEFIAVLADQATAVMLDVRIGAALIESKWFFFDQARRPICHQLTLMPPDRTRFRQVIEADADMPLLRPAVLAPRAPDENGG
jgi:DNA-binding GntR family transcriptional regulator